MRKFLALAIAVSIYAVSAVVSIWADDISPGQQQELVYQMVSPAELTPVYISADPGPGTHIPGVPPSTSEGVIPQVIPQCNSPGRTFMF